MKYKFNEDYTDGIEHPYRRTIGAGAALGAGAGGILKFAGYGKGIIHGAKVGLKAGTIGALLLAGANGLGPILKKVRENGADETKQSIRNAMYRAEHNPRLPERQKAAIRNNGTAAIKKINQVYYNYDESYDVNEGLFQIIRDQLTNQKVYNSRVNKLAGHRREDLLLSDTKVKYDNPDLKGYKLYLKKLEAKKDIIKKYDNKLSDLQIEDPAAFAGKIGSHTAKFLAVTIPLINDRDSIRHLLFAAFRDKKAVALLLIKLSKYIGASFVASLLGTLAGRGIKISIDKLIEVAKDQLDKKNESLGGSIMQKLDNISKGKSIHEVSVNLWKKAAQNSLPGRIEKAYYDQDDDEDSEGRSKSLRKALKAAEISKLPNSNRSANSVKKAARGSYGERSYIHTLSPGEDTFNRKFHSRMLGTSTV